MNKTRVALAGLACALGFLLGRVSGVWDFEQGVAYIIMSDALLVVTIFMATKRMSARPSPNTGFIVVLVLVAVLFVFAMGVTSIANSMTDGKLSRYLMVAAAFVPLATVNRRAYQRWGAFAPLVLLMFAPAMTAIAWIVAGDVEVWASPVLFIVPTVVTFLFASPTPVISDKQMARAETGLAMTAAFLTGVTMVSSSFDYDAGASVLIGVFMAIVGWFLGVVLRRWNYAPSRVLTWQNMVVGVWIGQFMPGAAVMTAIALVAGWTLYGTLHGVAELFRREQRRRIAAE
jgi:hypothetical protein